MRAQANSSAIDAVCARVALKRVNKILCVDALFRRDAAGAPPTEGARRIAVSGLWQRQRHGLAGSRGGVLEDASLFATVQPDFRVGMPAARQRLRPASACWPPTKAHSETQSRPSHSGPGDGDFRGGFAAGGVRRGRAGGAAPRSIRGGRGASGECWHQLRRNASVVGPVGHGGGGNSSSGTGAPRARGTPGGSRGTAAGDAAIGADRAGALADPAGNGSRARRGGRGMVQKVSQPSPPMAAHTRTARGPDRASRGMPIRPRSTAPGSLGARTLPVTATSARGHHSGTSRVSSGLATRAPSVRATWV